MKKLVLSCISFLTACNTGINYTNPEQPRYSGGAQPVAPQLLHGDTLKIASFNIAFGVQIDSAIVMFRSTPELRDLDIILLQEMDDPGTKRIAEALQMRYVYYPAQLRKNTKREWGNAVLSRWPITEDKKLVLPHYNGPAATMRGATGVTLQIANRNVRVYSAHLGTIYNITPAERKDQLRTILEDATKYEQVIAGGDLNSASVGKVAYNVGYDWPTQHIGKTMKVGSLDHMVTKGFAIPETDAAGVVVNNHHASDHSPIWIKVVLR